MTTWDHPVVAPLSGTSWSWLPLSSRIAGPVRDTSGFSGLAAATASPAQGTTAGDLYGTVISSAYIDSTTVRRLRRPARCSIITTPLKQGRARGTRRPVARAGWRWGTTGHVEPVASNGDWAWPGHHGGPSNECSQGRTRTWLRWRSAANDVAAFLAPYETPFDYTAPSVAALRSSATAEL